MKECPKYTIWHWNELKTHCTMDKAFKCHDRGVLSGNVCTLQYGNMESTSPKTLFFVLFAKTLRPRKFNHPINPEKYQIPPIFSS
ncbi:hypothetical protein L2E82_16575 [Cichorium intybus]|uniref:Uncharacterized protein n=1 Tax=Cichorium intybus TaxID=13427 RepID=A0ACB9F786_CICIN|nr:hypothetical protein L2E82_16575 [Cichorium intybus]